METTAYRSGAVGAMMDEYERAARDLRLLIEGLSDEDFELMRDAETQDDSCRSIQTIMAHVVRAAYSYAEYFRVALGIPGERPQEPAPTRHGCLEGLDAALTYTETILEGQWQVSQDAMAELSIRARWGTVYDFEQMFEHAIVHILRHRRQIDRFLGRPRTTR